MKHLITTYCDDNRCNFVLQHWLESLRRHVNLQDIDIMVIYFGTQKCFQEKLKEYGIIVNVQKNMVGSRMSNIHYEVLSTYLEKHVYDQVLYCDCGDLIFQKDISELFTLHTNLLRLVIEPSFNFRLHALTLGLEDIRTDRVGLISETLGNKPTANCGFVIGPARIMKSIWGELEQFCHSYRRHGTDQLVINLIAYRDGFVTLPRTFNYVLFLSSETVFIGDDGFYCNKDGVIAVVHNAGQYDFARRIAKFGYRQGRLRPSFYAYAFRMYYKLLNLLS